MVQQVPSAESEDSISPEMTPQEKASRDWVISTLLSDEMEDIPKKQIVYESVNVPQEIDATTRPPTINLAPMTSQPAHVFPVRAVLDSLHLMDERDLRLKIPVADQDSNIISQIRTYPHTPAQFDRLIGALQEYSDRELGQSLFDPRDEGQVKSFHRELRVPQSLMLEGNDVTRAMARTIAANLLDGNRRGKDEDSRTYDFVDEGVFAANSDVVEGKEVIHLSAGPEHKYDADVLRDIMHREAYYEAEGSVDRVEIPYPNLGEEGDVIGVQWIQMKKTQRDTLQSILFPEEVAGAQEELIEEESPSEPGFEQLVSDAQAQIDQMAELQKNPLQEELEMSKRLNEGPENLQAIAVMLVSDLLEGQTLVDHPAQNFSYLSEAQFYPRIDDKGDIHLYNRPAFKYDAATLREVVGRRGVLTSLSAVNIPYPIMDEDGEHVIGVKHLDFNLAQYARLCDVLFPKGVAPE